MFLCGAFHESSLIFAIMTVVSELLGVIEEIQNKTELVNYGDVWRKFTQQHEPPSPLHHLGSISTSSPREKRKSFLSGGAVYKETFEKMEAHKEDDIVDSPPPQTKTVVFVEQGDGPLPVIKEPIEDVVVRQSGLSKLFSPVKVNVFLPHKKRSIKFDVPQTTTFGQLILMCIKYRNKELASNRRRLEESIDAYNIRIALKNGKPDDNYPALLSKTSGTVENWKQFGYFVLIENPDYKPPEDPTPPSESKMYLQVFLPSGAYNILLVDASMKMKKVLQSVCLKRQLTANNYVAMTVKKTAEGERWDEVSGSQIVSDLDYLEVTLVQKSHLQSLESEEVWYPGFATQEKTYHNIMFYRPKKLTIKEESISLRVDADYITLIPQKKKAKILQFPTEEIVGVSQNETNPTRFQVECGEKILTFETPNTAVCKEIIFKIQFLIDLERESQQTTPE